jgi:hypothetical protein
MPVTESASISSSMTSSLRHLNELTALRLWELYHLGSSRGLVFPEYRSKLRRVSEQEARGFYSVMKHS